MPVDKNITIGQLENGVTYYIRENHDPEKRAELRLVINAGSVLEDDDQVGLAHFVEHMAFNGTQNFEKQDLVEYLELIGTRFELISMHTPASMKLCTNCACQPIAWLF